MLAYINLKTSVETLEFENTLRRLIGNLHQAVYRQQSWPSAYIHK